MGFVGHPVNFGDCFVGGYAEVFEVIRGVGVIECFDGQAALFCEFEEGIAEFSDGFVFGGEGGGPGLGEGGGGMGS